jgi:hypothetical protein
MDEPEVVPVVVVPDVEPESEPNLAMHVGRLHESHEAMRREWETHREEMAQLKGLVITLKEELETVEDVAEEIASEEGVESATVADPVTAAEPRRVHPIHRALRGY